MRGSTHQPDYHFKIPSIELSESCLAETKIQRLETVDYDNDTI